MENLRRMLTTKSPYQSPPIHAVTEGFSLCGKQVFSSWIDIGPAGDTPLAGSTITCRGCIRALRFVQRTSLKKDPLHGKIGQPVPDQVVPGTDRKRRGHRNFFP